MTEKKPSDNEVKKFIKMIIDKDTKIVAKNDSQKELIRSIKNNIVTICTGKAGTGKTFISLAYALSLLRSETNTLKKIYIIKSVTVLKGEELGFLKGTFEEKIDPVMLSYRINLEKIISSKQMKDLIEEEIIVPFPLAFARGTSIDNSIIILDEAQNVSLDNARTIMTRIGNNSKLILIGDINQIDMKNKKESSLDKLLNIFENVEGIGSIRMDNKDVNMRNPIIDVMEKKFEEYFNGR